MIVRCGRCRVELEVAGAGEFLCPNCGTRNAVRGAAPSPPVLDLGGRPPAAPDAPAPGVTWVVCPSCSYRFAIGDLPEVGCPSCAARLAVRDGTVVIAPTL